MTDSEAVGQARPLTPRQDRLDAELSAVLRQGGTRSALRAIVEELADYARLREVPAEDALATLSDIALRAQPAMASRADSVVGDSMPDRLTMITRWFSARYHRAD